MGSSEEMTAQLNRARLILLRRIVLYIGALVITVILLTGEGCGGPPIIQPPQLIDLKIPSIRIVTDIPINMQVNHSYVLKVSLVSASAKELIANIEGENISEIVTNPTPVGTPNTPFKDAFGPGYEPLVSAELYASSFDISPSNSDQRPQSLRQPKVEWYWNITPFYSGNQIIGVNILVQWVLSKSRSGAVPPLPIFSIGQPQYKLVILGPPATSTPDFSDQSGNTGAGISMTDFKNGMNTFLSTVLAGLLLPIIFQIYKRIRKRVIKKKGVPPNAISRLNQDLEPLFKAWRERPLQEHWRILYLDGIHFSVRHGDQVDSTLILTALGVDLAGNKEVLALWTRAEESKDGWLSVLEDLRGRGATQMDLIVTDGHDGLLAAVKELFPATPRQRCLLDKQRNVLNAVPRRVRHGIGAELAGIWAQPTKERALTQLAAFKAKYGKLYPEAVRGLTEEEDKTLTFYEFPQTMHRYIRTTKAIESLFSNVRQRTDQIDMFTTEMSCLPIVWATIMVITLRKVQVE